MSLRVVRMVKIQYPSVVVEQASQHGNKKIQHTRGKKRKKAELRHTIAALLGKQPKAFHALHGDKKVMYSNLI